MTKTLKVKDPFLRLDLGDVFERAENGDYVASVTEDFTNNSEDGKVYTTKYHASFGISEDYAKQMIEDGYLEEVPDTNDKKFINIFDEIDGLINHYSKQLNDVKASNAHPAVMREEETVYTNLLTVLNHLKSLKK